MVTRACPVAWLGWRVQISAQLYPLMG